MRSFLDPYPLGSRRAAFAPVQSDSVAQVSLAANVQQRVQIPAGSRFVAFSVSVDFWALIGESNVTAAIGSSGIAGNNACLNPSARRIPDDATHVSLIASSSGAGSLEFWSA